MPKRKKDKNRKAKYRPYRAVKMKVVTMSDPFGGAPMEVRRKVVLEVATKARAAFEADYPRVADWFDTYDPLYVLSFCVLYFLASEAGVDKEALEGRLEFAPHHLELLQAFALMGHRRGTAVPLKDKATELQRAMKELTDNLGLAQLATLPEGASDSELKKRFVIHEMRGQTFAIRNWAFPEQTYAQLKTLFSGSLEGKRSANTVLTSAA